MDHPQQRSRSMVFVLVVSAILLAVAVFLTILLITARNRGITQITPEIPKITKIYDVAGTLVTVIIDADKEMMLEGEVVIEAPSPVGGIPEVETQITPVPTDTATPLPPTPRPDPIIYINYTVMANDTLYSIAETQNSSVALMASKGFDANNLVPGTVLEGLPVANPAYCPPGSRAYVVRDKETVFSIANRFNTTVAAIAALNQLNAQYYIEMTQVICIPNQG